MPTERAVHKNELATADIEEQVEYLRREAGAAVALRFIDNAERAFGQILALPGLGPLLGLDELPYEDIRRWHIDGFPRRMILYRPVSDGIEVVRVLHTSRDIPKLMVGKP
jgi:toxin ParE1/3/4